MDSPATTTTEQQQPKLSTRIYHILGDDIEDLDEYSEGGYHPVNIDDEFHDGRYRIVHKLGFGSYSTVWLARDRQQDRFVSLKFLRADMAGRDTSEAEILRRLAAPEDQQQTLVNHPGRPFVLELLDEFVVRGVNGSHRCLVTDTLGPSIAAVIYESDDGRLPRHVSRATALQCSKGLAYLHSCGVVHGDLHQGNILFEITGINSWTLEQVYEHMGSPRKLQIERVDDQPLTPAAPKYAVLAPNPTRLLQFCFTADCSVRIADFGESFLSTSQMMGKDLHTPTSIAAPEIQFEDNAVGMPTDIWAFACTLYQVLGNHHLLESLMVERNEILTEMVRTFGKLPDCWWKKWEERSRYFEEDGTFKLDSGDTSGEPRTVDLPERVSKILRLEDTSTQEEFEEQELLALEQLLVSMLRYDPRERINANEVVQQLSIMLGKEVSVL